VQEPRSGVVVHGSSTLGFVLGNKGIFGLWSLIGKKEIGNEGK
jgi:hypothetical protein